MHFSKIAILASAGVVAANNAFPAITAAPEAPVQRDLNDIISSAENIGEDAKTWVEDKADDVKTFAEDNASNAGTWVSDKVSDVKTAADGVETYLSTKVDAASSKIRSAADDVETRVNDNDDDDSDNADNAAVSLRGQSAIVAAMAALGATAFGFIMA
ncbi:hypothetical protein FZEAL_2695 [Fusarium zealandicum]|uniref:Uncharacterized protein n=1 Tax=Fusarium zealandicum TaxID=1053134 RepID=A0A8H4UQ97_9HYPO|nr:hypothetical protein FZEAL_2695 [Fusarium zealandicum]